MPILGFLARTLVASVSATCTVTRRHGGTFRVWDIMFRATKAMFSNLGLLRRVRYNFAFIKGPFTPSTSETGTVQLSKTELLVIT